MKDDFKEKLLEQFPEEIDDSNMYFEMAQMANEMNYERMAKCLFEISKDEYTHAKFIHDYMVMNGICVPDDLKCKWMTLEARAHKIYPDVPKCSYCTW